MKAMAGGYPGCQRLFMSGFIVILYMYVLLNVMYCRWLVEIIRGLCTSSHFNSN